jgi:hypothetical protein
MRACFKRRMDPVFAKRLDGSAQNCSAEFFTSNHEETLHKQCNVFRNLSRTFHEMAPAAHDSSFPKDATARNAIAEMPISILKMPKW